MKYHGVGPNPAATAAETGRTSSGSLPWDVRAYGSTQGDVGKVRGECGFRFIERTWLILCVRDELGVSTPIVLMSSLSE